MIPFLKNHGLFFLFIVIAIVFRFYNLNFGAPLYYHPDERQNIVYPVLSSHSLFMLDQTDFDNGTFPLIIIKLILSLFTFIFHFATDPFILTILISRGLSAFISLITLIAIYVIGKKLFGVARGYVGFALATFSIGFIQLSHFGTIEQWEGLFFFLLFYYSWRIAKYAKLIDGTICGVLLGLAMSTKILTVILIPAICSSFLLYLYHQHISKNNILRSIKKLILVFFVLCVSAFCSFFVTFSQIFTNTHVVNESIHYESDVALGKTSVFYTQGFFHTTPIIFQFTKVYPFLLNPLITVLFLIALLYIITAGILKRNYNYLLLSIFYLFIFVSESFFFVKWARYMIPTLPFIYCILGIAMVDWVTFAEKKIKNTDIFSYAFITIPIVTSFIFASAFFITVYLHPSTLFVASDYARKTIPANADILMESFDLGGTAFTSYFANIQYFNFYDYNTSTEDELANSLTKIDYIILPSQRIVRDRLYDTKTFIAGHIFYDNLFKGNLGFSLIYETPCDIACKLSYMGDPVFSLEETVNVFDRPTVFIFKKNHFLSQEQYLPLLR